MTKKNSSITGPALRFCATVMLLCVVSSTALAQGNSPAPTATPKQTAPPASSAAPAIEEKAEKILQRAITALGGAAYLAVRSSVGRGLYTPFNEGHSTLPSTFIDYIIYPDKERTEFRGGGTKVIQTNTGDTGWLYDSASKTLKDMTPKQIADFKQAMRTNVDNLLRGVWRKEGAQVAYVGRREAGLARRNEALRVTYADGFTVEFEFSAQDGLPAKIIYRRTNTEGEEITEEDRLAQFITTNGISSPFVIDHYTAGIQTSRINYESIEFNPVIADALFARPASVKAVK
jgi:hypothetical protein